METKRRSRYFSQSTGKSLQLTETDFAVLDILQTYRFLPSTFLRFLTGVHPNRLTDLRHEAGLIYCPELSWQVARNRERPALYELTPKARRLLIERALVRFPLNTYSSPFKHAVGECLTQVLFEIGAKQSGLAYISPEQIFERAGKFELPVSFSYQIPDTNKTVHVEGLEPDGLPCGFRNPDNGHTIYFPGFEYDRDTETINPKKLRKADIYRKFQSYREAARKGLFKSHLTLPNAIVPIITVNESRMKSMMALLSDITEGRGSGQFIFKVMPDFAGWDGYPKPDATFLTEGWQKVGKDGIEPFSLLDELGKLKTD